MIFVVPLIISVLCFALIPGRRRANRQAAKMLELQSVAAMTEDMKEEYWARKRLENAPNPLMSNGKAARRMFLVFIGLIASVVAVGIMFGGNG